MSESIHEARVALITGATSGIGFATAVELARRQVQILLHGRDQQSARKAANRVCERVTSARVHCVWGDLSVMAEVRALAEDVLQQPRLDIVIHNAGLERWERQITRDGFELTFAVNHLAPFLLTRLLTPLLESSRPARVVYISSIVHGWGVMHWDDLQAAGWYSPEPVYYQSKLAAALSAQEFARRLAPKGISVLLVPPALTRTSFGRDFQGFAGWWVREIGARLFRAPEVVAQEIAEAALSAKFAALTGAYLDRLVVSVPAARARVHVDQLRVWQKTCELLHLSAAQPPPIEHLPPVPLPRPPLSSWLRAVTTGELLGFTSTAAIAFLALRTCGHPETVRGRVIALLIMVLAGTLEGASIGFFQWRALQRWLPDLSALRFVGATIAVAATGWLVGMSVPLMMSLTGTHAAEPAAKIAEPSGILIAALAMGFGAIAGALFGAAQARALSSHVRSIRAWVVANVAGWALGLPFSYLAGSVGSEGMAWWQALGLSAAAAVCMGLCIAGTTFIATRRMEPSGATG